MIVHLATVKSYDTPPNYLWHGTEVMNVAVPLQSFTLTTDHRDAATLPLLEPNRHWLCYAMLAHQLLPILSLIVHLPFEVLQSQGHVAKKQLSSQMWWSCFCYSYTHFCPWAFCTDDGGLRSARSRPWRLLFPLQVLVQRTKTFRAMISRACRPLFSVPKAFYKGDKRTQTLKKIASPLSEKIAAFLPHNSHLCQSLKGKCGEGRNNYGILRLGRDISVDAGKPWVARDM